MIFEVVRQSEGKDSVEIMKKAFVIENDAGSR